MVAEGETQPLFRRFGRALAVLRAGLVSGASAAGLGASAAGAGAASAGLGASAGGAGLAAAGLGASAAGAGFASAGLGASAAGGGQRQRAWAPPQAVGFAAAGLGASARGLCVGGLGRLGSRGCCVGGLGRLGSGAGAASAGLGPRRPERALRRQAWAPGSWSGFSVGGLGRLSGRAGAASAGLGVSAASTVLPRRLGASAAGAVGAAVAGGVSAWAHAPVAGPSASNVTNNHRRLQSLRGLYVSRQCASGRKQENVGWSTSFSPEPGTRLRVTTASGVPRRRRWLRVKRADGNRMRYRLSMFGREAKLASLPKIP